MIPSASSFLVSTLFSSAHQIVVLYSATVNVSGSIDPYFLALVNLDNPAILDNKCYGAKPD